MDHLWPKHESLIYQKMIILFYCLLFFQVDGNLAWPQCQRPNTGALVLARGGSKGIRLKNLSIVGNRTLLGRTLITIHQAGIFDSVWVSTDNSEISNEAKTYQAQVHRRAVYTATDEASSLNATKEFLLYHPEIEILCLVQCTSPFLKSAYLSEALRLILSGKADSVFSVSRQYKLRWKIVGSTLKPENFNPRQRPRRQDWGGELVENGMFYFTRTDLLIQESSFQSGILATVEVPEEESLEIDSLKDLHLANFLVGKLIL